jgi:pimeloyl-ACP methyl ester carboxylesterase
VGLPKTEFVVRADSHLAYQVFGTGTAKLLMLYGVPSHLDYFWEFPLQVRVHERLARLARVAVYDWRGYGMSDPLPMGGYPIEELAADALAVLDAAHFERAVLWGDFAGGAVAVWLAVHRPARVDGLILVDSSAPMPAMTLVSVKQRLPRYARSYRPLGAPARRSNWSHRAWRQTSIFASSGRGPSA